MSKGNKVLFEIYRAHSSLGLVLWRLNRNNNGGGYRVFGPKLHGQSEPLREVLLDLEDLERLKSEISDSIKFLKETSK